MALTGISPVNQQRIAVLVPIVALLVSLFVVYPAWGRYTELRGTISSRQAELDALKTAPLPDPGPRQATAPAQPTTEPVQFSALITTMARQSNCQVAGFDIAAPTETSGDESAGLIRPLEATIEVEATYPNLRVFLARLAEAPRLYVVKELEITNQKTGAQAGFEASADTLRAKVKIERYVELPDTAEKAAAP